VAKAYRGLGVVPGARASGLGQRVDAEGCREGKPSAMRRSDTGEARAIGRGPQYREVCREVESSKGKKGSGRGKDTA